MEQVRFLLFLAFALSLNLGVASGASGDLGTKFRVNDEDPTQGIPSEAERNAFPLEFGYFLQDLVARAQIAYRAKEWRRSIKYYEALARTVPERAVSYSKLCVAYDIIGEAEKAIANCQEAQGHKGAKVMDHTRFLKLMLNRKELDSDSIEAVEASLNHLRKHEREQRVDAKYAAEAKAKVVKNLRKQLGKDEPSVEADATPKSWSEAAKKYQGAKGATKKSDEAGAALPLRTQIELYECKLAALTKNSTRLNRCIRALTAQKADAGVVLGFKWSRAVAKKSETELEAVLGEAATLGYSAKVIQTMRDNYDKAVRSEASASATTPSMGLGGRIWLVLLGVGLVLCATVVALRRRKLSAAT